MINHKSKIYFKFNDQFCGENKATDHMIVDLFVTRCKMLR